MSGRWPLHPPPYPHESLSSWLERQTSCYGYHCRDLLVYDLGFSVLSPEQLDTDPPALLLECLAERSGISAEQLGTMTIQGWVPQLIDSLKPDAGSYPMYVREHALLYPTELRRHQEFDDWVPWMSPHRFSGRAACRLCLRDGPEPYRRLCWRMAWMTSCPMHGLLLEESIVVAGRFFSEVVDEPVAAPKEILTLDRFTRSAIEEGMVSLPCGLVPSGTWLRVLRTLLDELSLPAASLKQYRPTLAKVWGTLGLGIRQGMRSAAIPFERLDSPRQFLLMRVAGVAIELLMKGELKKVGKDAHLFKAIPREDHEARTAPLPDLPLEKKESVYEQAWRKALQATAEVEEAMRHDPKTAREMRKLLLGSTPTAEKIEKIDRFWRSQGYLLCDDVI